MLRAVLRRTFATRESETMARTALNQAKCIAFDVDSYVAAPRRTRRAVTAASDGPPARRQDGFDRGRH